MLIGAGACGAFVAVLRQHAEIVLAHANPESPKSAALPFPQGSHSFGRLELSGAKMVAGTVRQTLRAQFGPYTAVGSSSASTSRHSSR